MVWRRGGSSGVRSLLFPPNPRREQGRTCHDSLCFGGSWREKAKSWTGPEARAVLPGYPGWGPWPPWVWNRLSVLLTLGKWEIISYAVLTLSQHCCLKQDGKLYPG